MNKDTEIILLKNYFFPGFDLEHFVETIGTNIDNTLEPEFIPIFLHQSKLFNFLNEEKCDRFSDLFQGRQWTSGM